MNTSTLQMRLLHAETIERDYAAAATTCASADRGPLLDMAHQASERRYALELRAERAASLIIPEFPR